MMKNKTLLAATFFTFLLCAAVRLHAQGPVIINGSGCVDSPEAPTDVLLVVGTIGMFYGSSLISKLRRK